MVRARSRESVNGHQPQVATCKGTMKTFVIAGSAFALGFLIRHVVKPGVSVHVTEDPDVARVPAFAARLQDVLSRRLLRDGNRVGQAQLQQRGGEFERLVRRVGAERIDAFPRVTELVLLHVRRLAQDAQVRAEAAG